MNLNLAVGIASLFSFVFSFGGKKDVVKIRIEIVCCYKNRINDASILRLIECFFSITAIIGSMNFFPETDG